MEHEFLSKESRWYWAWRNREVFEAQLFPFFEQRAGIKKMANTEKGRKLYQQALKRVEIAAFRYELARRHDRSKKMPPFWRLTPEARDFLEDPLRRLPIQTSRPPHQQDKWVVVPMLYLNPEASMNAILNQFRNFVKKESDRRGIQRPHGPLKTRHRAVSWRLVEVMDLNFYYEHLKREKTPHKHKLNPSQRAALSRANQDSKKHFENFIQRCAVEVAMFLEPAD